MPEGTVADINDEDEINIGYNCEGMTWKDTAQEDAYWKQLEDAYVNRAVS